MSIRMRSYSSILAVAILLIACTFAAWQTVRILSVAGFAPSTEVCCSCGNAIAADAGWSLIHAGMGMSSPSAMIFAIRSG